MPACPRSQTRLFKGSWSRGSRSGTTSGFFKAISKERLRGALRIYRGLFLI